MCQATNERGSAQSSAYIWVNSKYLLTSGDVFKASQPISASVYLRLEGCTPPNMVCMRAHCSQSCINRCITWCTVLNIVNHIVLMDAEFVHMGGNFIIGR